MYEYTSYVQERIPLYSDAQQKQSICNQSI